NAEHLGQVLDDKSGTQLVEVELVEKRLGERSRDVKKKAAAVPHRRFDDDEIGDDLALRRQQRAETCLARAELEDIGANEPMEKAPRVFAGNLEHAAVREKGSLHASRLSWHRTPNLRCRPRPLKWAGKPAVQRLGTACAQSAARERSFRDAGKARGSGMTMPLKSKARPLLPRQLHRKLAVANSRGKVFRVTGGRFLAVGGNQLGECQEERGLRQAIAIDAVVMRLRPRLLQTNERQALLFVI